MTDARIEAAAKAIAEYVYERNGKPMKWENMGDNRQEVARCYARVSLAAADAANWRPIESAPRDGTRFMIRKTTGHICVAFFDDGEWYGDDWYCVHHDEYITHWQPLPAPPNDDVKS